MVRPQEFWKNQLKKSSFQDLDCALINQFKSSKQKVCRREEQIADDENELESKTF